MNNEEKDLKNVEVANETEKNTRFGRKNKQKAEGNSMNVCWKKPRTPVFHCASG